MAARLAAIVVWTLPAMLIQVVFLLLPGRAKELFTPVYWQGICWILGLRLTVIGRPAEHRPVLYVANHCSWLDIIALGAVLPGCFIAKGEIAGWPFINWVTKLGRTIFVTRNRTQVARERAILEARLSAGDNIVLFPEGTTSDGSHILPFATSFLALADAPAKPFIQPVTLVFDGLDGLPVLYYDRPEISWYGDMELVPHFARIGRRRRIHATLILDAAIAPGTFADRKVLSAALEARISHNAAALRQHRAVS